MTDDKDCGPTQTEKQRLTRNAIECHNCGTTIESTHRHDMRRCACPSDNDAVWVDGGLAYQRGQMGLNANFTDISEYYSSPSAPENVEKLTVTERAVRDGAT